jgi:hypothetical protein
MPFVVFRSLLTKAGEGTRGGVVIGHTTSGKPIYKTHDAVTTRGWNSTDHKEAEALHRHHALNSASLAESMKHSEAAAHHKQQAIELKRREPRKRLAKADGPRARGGKYYRRVPTGDPKRPWKYYYTKEDYEAEHGDNAHLEGASVLAARAMVRDPYAHLTKSRLVWTNPITRPIDLEW